jgi:MerR family transcriptional regulator, light-induced transcriptional regulator
MGVSVGARCEVSDLADLFYELGEPSRRQILGALRRGPRKVGEIVKATGLKQPNVSNHLARLRGKGFVHATKKGREVYYRLASPEVEAAVLTVAATLPPEVPDVPLDQLGENYAKEAVAGNEEGCRQIFQSVLGTGLDPLSVYCDFITPAMAVIGAWYKLGAIDEGQEHLASEITLRLLARSAPGLGSGAARIALVGAGPDNHHVLGLRLVADYLRYRGWRTLYLGANCPIDAFLNAIRHHQPHLVLTGICAEVSVAGTQRLLRAVKRLRKEIDLPAFSVGIGGRLAEPLRESLLRAGADLVQPSLRAFAAEELPGVEAALEPEGSVPTRRSSRLPPDSGSATPAP